jgi:hypothetical protein
LRARKFIGYDLLNLEVYLLSGVAALEGECLGMGNREFLAIVEIGAGV